MDKERFDKELEIKQQETVMKQQELESQNKKIEKELDIRDEELKLKKFETEANIKLREKELEIQENVKKEEVKQTKIQLVKEMISQGKTKEEIKEILELLN